MLSYLIGYEIATGEEIMVGWYIGRMTIGRL